MIETGAPADLQVEPCRKRLRAYLGGELVFDTTRPVLVWEVPQYPTYYVPLADVEATLAPTGEREHAPDLGTADLYDVVTERATARRGARRYAAGLAETLRGLVRFEWGLLDEWLEEDEPVYTHARNPYSRVDILASSRHVRIEVDGVTVAESRAPRILFETGLPPRYYLPMSDVRLDMLRPSDTVTHCPYKGRATYWSVEVNGRRYDDYVWCYRLPLPESQKIAGLLCFYNERVALFVDGVPEGRAETRH